MKTLKKGVHASDMDQLLSSTGPFTFFAPTDQAFDKLAKGTMENLLEPQNRNQLEDLIKNHVVNGKVYFKEMKDGDKLITVNGKELLITVKDGKVNIGNALLESRDGKISNGVIHPMDTVMM